MQVTTDWDGVQLAVEFYLEPEGYFIDSWSVYASGPNGSVEISGLLDEKSKLWDHLTTVCLNEAMNGEPA